MFGLSFGEMAIVAILVLVLLGPDQVPAVARTMGKALRDFRRATDGIKQQLAAEMAPVERTLEDVADLPEDPELARAFTPAVTPANLPPERVPETVTASGTSDRAA